jgi:CRISPR system Cascade subunit CasE
MMYLSHLLIDVGSNPDRPRPGRLWLRNIYHVHQRLSMAFSTSVPRAENARFLFRVDNSVEDDDPRAIILVQSDLPPDWDYAFHNARILLAAPPESKEYNPTFLAGEEFQFRIRLNLSKKSKSSKDGVDLQRPREGTDAKGRPRSQSKRVALTWKREEGEQPDEMIQEWFASKAEGCGFSLREFHLLHLGWVTAYRAKAKKGKTEGQEPDRQMRFRSALLEGVLAVTDATDFAEAVFSGIGSAKAFGFGLLSIAPVRI